MEKLQDIDICDEELAQYFVEDEGLSNAFNPTLVPNSKLVEDDGLEGTFILHSFNSISRWRRNRNIKGVRKT